MNAMVLLHKEIWKASNYINQRPPRNKKKLEEWTWKADDGWWCFSKDWLGTNYIWISSASLKSLYKFLISFDQTPLILYKLVIFLHWIRQEQCSFLNLTQYSGFLNLHKFGLSFGENNTQINKYVYVKLNCLTYYIRLLHYSIILNFFHYVTLVYIFAHACKRAIKISLNYNCI